MIEGSIYCSKDASEVFLKCPVSESSEDSLHEVRWIQISSYASEKVIGGSISARIFFLLRLPVSELSEEAIHKENLIQSSSYYVYQEIEAIGDPIHC